MSDDNGYSQTVSTSEFNETPRLVLEQATGDVYIETWDQQEIEVTTPDDDDEFELEVSGPQVLVRARPPVPRREEWGNFVPDLSNLGIDVDKVAARVQRNLHRTIRRTGRNIDINIDLGRWAGSRDYHIKVPFNCHLSLRTSSGDIHATGPHGTHLIQTTSGDIKLLDVAGNVLVSSASGDLRIENIEGKLGIKTASGEIDVLEGNLHELSAHTASGDISLDLTRVPTQEFDVRTVSGDIQVYLPDDAAMNVEVVTLSGDIQCSLPHTKQRNGRMRALTVNGGGTSARMGTVSGDVSIDAGRRGSSGNRDQSGEEGEARTPVGPSARQQAEMEILQMVERGELSPQDAMRRLGDLPR